MFKKKAQKPEKKIPLGRPKSRRGENIPMCK
jgi:hypothetical protein